MNSAVFGSGSIYGCLHRSSIGNIRIKKNSIVQLKLQLAKNLYDLKINNEIKGLRINGLKADLEDAKRLATIGGGTQEAIEKVKLNLDPYNWEIIMNWQEKIQKYKKNLHMVLKDINIWDGTSIIELIHLSSTIILQYRY